MSASVGSCFVPNGGPDGGDGGKGGDVIFEVDEGSEHICLNTVTDAKFTAQNGEQGGKKRCHGANGEDIVLKVPEGTVIKEAESGQVIADMSGDNSRQVILKRRPRGQWKYALCHLDDAGAQICTARAGSPVSWKYFWS